MDDAQGIDYSQNTKLTILFIVTYVLCNTHYCIKRWPRTGHTKQCAYIVPYYFIILFFLQNITLCRIYTLIIIYTPIMLICPVLLFLSLFCYTHYYTYRYLFVRLNSLCIMYHTCIRNKILELELEPTFVL